MKKKILIILGISLLTAYLVWTVIYFRSKPQEELCEQFRIEATDSITAQLLNVGQLETRLANQGFSPYGKHLKDIDTDSLEAMVLQNKIVQKAEAYVTDGGFLVLKVTTKNPILRIIPENSDGYYIDSEGTRMPLSEHFTVYLPVATGRVAEKKVIEELFRFALFLKNNEFWNAQIEQIDVRADGDVVLVPRVGNQKIVLGSFDGFEEKLERLRTFYHRGMGKAGWEKYSLINLKYDGQIVCTRS